MVRDQQTIVIGGLMRDEYVTSRDKVPVLGDVPVLGFLFSSTRREKKQSNLLLILTPHVIREQADLRRFQRPDERQAAQTFGGDVDEVIFTGDDASCSSRLFFRVERTVEAGRRDADAGERVDLVLHQ